MAGEVLAVSEPALQGRHPYLERALGARRLGTRRARLTGIPAQALLEGAQEPSLRVSPADFPWMPPQVVLPRQQSNENSNKNTKPLLFPVSISACLSKRLGLRSCRHGGPGVRSQPAGPLLGACPFLTLQPVSPDPGSATSHVGRQIAQCHMSIPSSSSLLGTSYVLS